MLSCRLFTRAISPWSPGTSRRPHRTLPTSAIGHRRPLVTVAPIYSRSTHSIHTPFKRTNKMPGLTGHRCLVVPSHRHYATKSGRPAMNVRWLNLPSAALCKTAGLPAMLGDRGDVARSALRDRPQLKGSKVLAGELDPVLRLVFSPGEPIAGPKNGSCVRHDEAQFVADHARSAIRSTAALILRTSLSKSRSGGHRPASVHS